MGYGTRASMILRIYLQNLCHFCLPEPKLFLRIRSEWLSATGAAFKIYTLQCVCQAFSETAALCLGTRQLLYSRLTPFGVFLAQRHTQYILGLFLKLLLIISLPSGSCNWTDASKVPGFSGRYFRRNSLTKFLVCVFNCFLFYYPTIMTPVKRG